MSAKQNTKIIGYVDLDVCRGAYGYRKICLSLYMFVCDFKRPGSLRHFTEQLIRK